MRPPSRLTEFDPQRLGRMYNNRDLVPDHAAYFERWRAASAALRAGADCELDVAYGESASEQLDVFRTAAARAPVLVFIHGGWWRSLDKADHSFVAPAFTHGGVCVVVPNYALCPAVTIPDIVLQMVRALAWTWRHVARFGGDPRRITLAGHSAGGHLASLLLNCDWRAVGDDLPADLVTRALSVSGVYDLEPIMHTPFLQQDLRLTHAQVRRASPAWQRPRDRRRLYAAVGAAESAEFVRQQQLLRECWGERSVPVSERLPGLNHFDVVDALADPRHRLHAMARDLLEEGGAGGA